MLVLVTGGAGFIGSHLVDRYLADGHRVRVLDDFSTGREENLAPHASLEIVRGDVGEFAQVDAAMKGVDLVFHQAAVASVPRTVNDPLGSQRTNYQGTLNVLEAARRNGTRRAMFAASAACYGDLPQLPKREDSATMPLSPYAVDKLASEHACYVYSRLYGLQTVRLRYFNVFGPRQDPGSPYSGVISIFADRLSRGETPVIYGDGEQTRDFVYVDDVVEANVKGAAAPAAAGGVFNVATGHPVSLNELLDTMCRILGRPFAPEYQAAREGDIRHSWAAIDLAKERLGWAPRTGLEQGLRKLLSSPARGAAGL